ncbi:MAG: hypothetical protein IT427_10675 [Pirellulales bacterium]|nr:hypothetical protein [Pirellulales bacterium]
MAEVELLSTKYAEQAERTRAEASAALKAAESAAAPVSKRPHPLEQSTKYVSIAAAGAAIFCVIAIAVPMLASLGSGKRSAPIDWFLRMGGASSDQTFDKFMTDSIITNQRELERQFRNSPISEFDPEQLKSLTSELKGWQLSPMPPVQSRLRTRR